VSTCALVVEGEGSRCLEQVRHAAADVSKGVAGRVFRGPNLVVHRLASVGLTH
jgi:hypothetical protein